VFRRNRRTGRLAQARGAAGCVAAKGAAGCAPARGLRGPNSVSVSADGRNVYATSVHTSAVSAFRRNPKTGALAQVPGSGGCVAAAPVPGCAAGRALAGADVVVVSPDGANVYVGAFFGDAVAVFTRNTSTGALTQPTDTTGCVAAATSGCATGLALDAPEGLAISADGSSVYAATAVSNAVVTFTRAPGTGALTQATDGSGCIVAAPLTGCTTGTQLSGANAVAVSPDDDDVYVTSLISNSLTSFTRASTGALTQQSGTSACAINLLAVGCSLGRLLKAPEGLTVSPDGADVYATAFTSGALDVFVRDTGTGALIQHQGRPGCLIAAGPPACRRGRALKGASSVVVSPDGRYAYATAFGANAVDVFRRATQWWPAR
jgi:DNA-binding beta-propeller fold protein YncE